jgi:hypothetical protein|uniref:Pirin C-terminal domain-containing protein n=1 Tax=Zea mays TaxID=4577 RepID=A0A804QKT4_MAIZE
MIEPRYQELERKDISRGESENVDMEARVIAGEALGVASPVYTLTPTMYVDFTMRPGSRLHQSVLEGWNAFIYVIDGDGVFGRATATAHYCLVLGPGDGVSVWNRSTRPLRFVLVAGQPLGVPVVQHRPFVMNSRAEIQKAMEDYYYGKNGFERAGQWSSSAGSARREADGTKLNLPCRGIHGAVLAQPPGPSPLSRCPSLKPRHDGCSSRPPPTARCPRPGLPLTTPPQIYAPACPCP